VIGDVLRDAVARVVVIEETIEDGNPSLAWTVARDLELDLRALAVRVDEAKAAA
jgi:hypothetical protein